MRRDGVFNIEELLEKITNPEIGRLFVSDIIIGLLLAFLIGLVISNVYKKTFQGILYSYSFSSSLVMMSLITSLIIMTISINLTLTLGMVGALSIIRFRTAIKDPMDIVFIFWAIATGLATGAKLYMLAFIGMVIISLVVFVLFKHREGDLTFMLVLRYKDVSLTDKSIFMEFKKLKHTMKSKTYSDGKIELVVELRLIGEDTSFVDKLSSITGVSDATLIKYSGDHIS